MKKIEENGETYFVFEAADADRQRIFEGAQFGKQFASELMKALMNAMQERAANVVEAWQQVYDLAGLDRASGDVTLEYQTLTRRFKVVKLK